MANVVLQGSFVSTGSSVYIPLRSGVTWMRVQNLTQLTAAQTVAVGVEYEWSINFPDSEAKIAHFKSNAVNAANLIQYITTAGAGFKLYDSSNQTPGALVSTITAISNAAIPVVTNTGVNGLAAGDVVRLVNIVGGQQLGGYDFTVGYNTLSATTFSLDYMAQIVAATTGSFRKINFNPIFYPRHRYITKITAAQQAVVTMSVTHGYKVGQVVRFVVPPAFGMSQINGLQGTITAINTTTTTGNSITVDIDSSAFTAFAFPVTADVPFTPALVIPVGEDTAEAVSAGQNILSDATVNDATIGLVLAGGANNPAGANNDVIIWQAGTADDAYVQALG